MSIKRKVTMDLHIDDNPTTTTTFSPPKFLQISSSSQNSKSLLPQTMNDPRFQFSQARDHEFNDPFSKNGSRLCQTNENCSNLCSDQEFVQFRPNFYNHNAAESDDSGVCSPPLWKNSPSPSRSPSQQPLLGHHVYRSLSPTARLQAITRGQKELMEMVKSMPESSYELSLKDLVEHHRIEAQTGQTPPQTNNQSLQQRGAVKVKRQESKKNDKTLLRNGSFELESKGMFLNMVFPFSLHSKKKKNLDRISSGRVSLKPEAVKGGSGGAGGGDRDWWKKKFTGSSDSDSSRISNNSGGGSSRSSSRGSSSGRSYGGCRKKNEFPKGCWPFFKPKTGKSVE